MSGRGDKRTGDMSANAEDDIAFIRALAELLAESGLSEVEVSRRLGSDRKLEVRLSRVHVPATAPAAAPAAQAVAPAAAPPPPAAPQPAAESGEAPPAGPDLSKAVLSPMVGTVYLAPEPGAEPFVRVGDRVSEGQTLLIIEAMKTMNQIPSPRDGVVREILVSNAEPVEYGHPLMIID